MTICLLGSIDWFRFATIASFLVEHLREIDDEFGDDEKGPVFLANLVEARHERVNEVFGRTSKPNPVSDESETRHYDIREVRIDLHSSDIDSLLPENLSRALVINYLKSASLVLSGRGQLTDGGHEVGWGVRGGEGLGEGGGRRAGGDGRGDGDGGGGDLPQHDGGGEP